MVHKMNKTKQKHNTICAGHHYAQTNPYNVNRPYKQLEVKTSRTSFLCGYRNGHCKTELVT